MNSIAIGVMLTLCLSVLSIQEALAVGLKVYVTLSHSNNGATKICVNSDYQNLGCETVTLSGLQALTRTDLLHLERVWSLWGENLPHVLLISLIIKIDALLGQTALLKHPSMFH
jgi:hypothetical protein